METFEHDQATLTVDALNHMLAGHAVALEALSSSSHDVAILAPSKAISVDELNATVASLSPVALESPPAAPEASEPLLSDVPKAPLEGGIDAVFPQLLHVTGKYNIDIAAFQTRVRSYLDERCYCWAFGINVDNQLYSCDSKGWLRLTPDVGASNAPGNMLKPGSRTDVYSCSKTITAVAMAKLLHDRGESWFTPVCKYLPPNLAEVGYGWEYGPYTDKITFWHLLTHHAGYMPSHLPSDFKDIKQHFKTGPQIDPDVAATQDPVYQNFGFAAMRYAAWFLLGNPYDKDAWTPVSDVFVFREEAGRIFCRYVRSVLAPAGIENIVWGPSYSIPSQHVYRRYPYPPDFKTPGAGANWTDNYEETAGAGSMYLSVVEMLQFLGALFSGKLLPELVFKEMISHGIGMPGLDVTAMDGKMGKLGSYVSHGGNLGDGKSLWMGFPGNIQVFWVSNCCDDVPTTQREERMRDMFDASLIQLL